MKDVVDQFQAKETFMGQSLEPINKMPTIILCLHSEYEWVYSRGIVSIQYGKDGKMYQILKENQDLEMPNEKEVISLHQVSQQCYQLTSMISSKPERALTRYITIHFPNVSQKFIPPSMTAFFTSKENSYGEFNREWFDGQVFRQTVQVGYFAKISLRPVEYTYLNFDDQCSNKTFLEQWMPYLLKANFSECQKRCTHTSFFVSNDFPLCGWEPEDAQARTCSYYRTHDSYQDFKTRIGYTRPCYILEYLGETNHNGKLHENVFIIQYNFAPPEMTLHYTERYVFDVVGMIGSVGGTLGMCIGFSFSGFTSTVLGCIKAKMKNLF